MCALFLLWRKANSIGRIVSHQMKTWTTTEGRVRLSADDGPAATSFLGDDPADDSDDDEPLSGPRNQKGSGNGSTQPVPDASAKPQNSQGLTEAQSSPSPRPPLAIS
ncbi:hypothetical protein AX16_007463 [Volvariella volvacea WC 439]|nr:hypothetical protein AX16_007463 [Volvariella volvacea WC 439]